MRCPNCDATLRTIEYEGIQIETCDPCQGEWLDATELRKIVRIREVRFSPEERQEMVAATSITPIIPQDHDRDLKCPKCGGQTDAVNYGGDSGIVIDKCTNCGGVWLDPGELENLQKLVESWRDNLPTDLQRFGKRLREVEAEVDARDDVRVSRFRFVNAIINGILDRVI